MCPSPNSVPPRLLGDLTKTFGGLDEFEEQFTRVAKSLFGSGYVWLCEDVDGSLVITTTQNQVSSKYSSANSKFNFCIPQSSEANHIFKYCVMRMLLSALIAMLV